MASVDSRYLKWILEHQKKMSAVWAELHEYMAETLANRYDCILYPKGAVITVKWKIKYNDDDEDGATYEYSPTDGNFWSEMIEDLEEIRGFWFEEWDKIH